MRFDAFLPTYWDDYEASPIPTAIAEAATAAEALGYEGVWANNNVVSPTAARRGTLKGSQVVESLVTLASLVHLVPRSVFSASPDSSGSDCGSCTPSGVWGSDAGAPSWGCSAPSSGVTPCD